MSTNTPNIGLVKPQDTDIIDYQTIFNANADKIDEQIGNLSGAVGVIAKMYESKKVAIANGWDWTPVLNYCLSLLPNGGELILPSELFYFSEIVVDPNIPIHIKGAGRGVTIAKVFGTNSRGFAFIGQGAALAYQFSLGDLTITSDGAVSSGIYLYSAAEFKLYNIKGDTIQGQFVHADGIQDCKWDHLHATDCGTSTLPVITLNNWVGVQAGDGCNRVIANDLRVERYNSIALLLDTSAYANDFTDCKFHGPAMDNAAPIKTAVIVKGRYNKFSGCQFSHAGLNGILLDLQGYGNVVNGGNQFIADKETSQTGIKNTGAMNIITNNTMDNITTPITGTGESVKIKDNVFNVCGKMNLASSAFPHVVDNHFINTLATDYVLDMSSTNRAKVRGNIFKFRNASNTGTPNMVNMFSANFNVFKENHSYQEYANNLLDINGTSHIVKDNHGVINSTATSSIVADNIENV